MKLFVGNLSDEISEDDLKEAFSKHGTPVSVTITNDKKNSRSFAFVEMSSAEEAESAIKELNNKEIKGAIIKVNEARPSNDSQSRFNKSNFNKGAFNNKDNFPGAKGSYNNTKGASRNTFTRSQGRGG